MTGRQQREQAAGAGGAPAPAPPCRRFFLPHQPGVRTWAVVPQRRLAKAAQPRFKSHELRGFEFPPEDEDAPGAEPELPDELLQWYHQANPSSRCGNAIEGQEKST